MSPALHLADLTTDAIRTFDMPMPIGWALPRASSHELVVGLKTGFAWLDLLTGETRMIGNPEADRPSNRLNDAKVDPWGRIWAGSKDDGESGIAGALYRLDPDLSWSRQDDGYSVTNGPTFSLDGSTLYHTDSGKRIIYAFSLAKDGTLSGKREWLRFEDGWGYPDGMTTDEEGCLWIAHWEGGRISRFSPEGVMLRSIELPASNITSCTFAGDDLSRMFVTSSTIGHEDEQYAGALFEVFPGVAGLPSTAFAG